MAIDEHGRRTENESSDDPSATLFDERDLVVVSNREPYCHEREGGSITVSEPAGGLTEALDPVLQETHGTWVAWGSGDADRETADEDGLVDVPPDDPAYDLQRVWLSDEQVDGYYYGYSNQVLWPLCHGDVTRVNHSEEFWNHYREANEIFADAVAKRCSDSSFVWFQDYHLALAPRIVRERVGAEQFLTQFWHIPWPSWDVLQTCPQYRELLDGLLANDLVGFHTERYCTNFLDCVDAALDARVDYASRSVEYRGQRTFVRAAPIGIDTESFETLASSDETAETWRTFAAERGLEDVRIGVGVDRLDYTKGIVERLAALERFWEEHPERRGGFTYVQKAIESRSKIAQYQQLQEDVESEIERINERFATDDWTPILYLKGMLSQRELAALYRYADLGIVSSVRDGMNLVAKEYVAAQADADGVLLLSELTGASEELGEDAVRIHPHDTVGFAEAIEAALTMPEDERTRRMWRLREQVRENDIYAWMDALFRAVQAIERVENARRLSNGVPH